MDALLSIAPPDGLAVRWRALRSADPELGLADVAARLDASEAEVLASSCGDDVVRLEGPYGELLRVLPGLGRVRAVTRNALAAMEAYGTYPPPDGGCSGFSGEIGARVFLEHWRHGYAFERSLHFFDGRGEAVHEIFPVPESDALAWSRLIDLFACFDQTPGESLVVASPLASRPSDAGRMLRCAAQARPVAPSALATVLATVVRDALPVSVAVRSAGVVQRYSGRLHDCSTAGGRVELSAPDVRSELRADRIAEAWVVRTPSLDGPTTSLELLDRRAKIVASFSAPRRPGTPEPVAWHALLDDLRTLL
jgi:putative hemin transport protein